MTTIEPELTNKTKIVRKSELLGFPPIACLKSRQMSEGVQLLHRALVEMAKDDEGIRHAVLGNAGTVISFRVGAEDAPYLSRELNEQFSPSDLIPLPNYQVSMRLMVDGKPTIPFSATTMLPPAVD